MPSRRRRRSPRPRWLLVPALIAFVLGLGVVSASAATLGGLRTADLGATQASVAAHASGVTLTWTPRWTGSAIAVASVTATTAVAQPFVATETVTLVLLTSSGSTICTLSATATASTTVTFSSATVSSTCGAVPYSSLDRISFASTAAVAP